MRMLTYEQTILDAAALRVLARTTAARIFPPRRQSWRSRIFSGPAPQSRPFRHLCERFVEGSLVKERGFKVEEGPSLRLRDDGIIEYGRYKVEQYDIKSYCDLRAATDDELCLADYRWEPEWSDGRERMLCASRGTLVVDRKGDGLRRLLEGLR